MSQHTFKRLEYKYLLTYDQYLKTRHYLINRGLIPDPYSSRSTNHQYYVASLYLDTPDHQAYWEKQFGLHSRVKYRLRTYAKTGQNQTPIFWETKKKFGDFQKKDRLRLSYDNTKSMLDSALNLDQLLTQSLEKETLTKYYFSWLGKNLQPSVLISYDREPYIDPFYPNFRLTFDLNIKASPSADLFSKNRLTQILPDQVIMEIKFTHLVPNYISHLNQSLDFYRQSISKYCLSLESCDIVAEENI